MFNFDDDCLENVDAYISGGDCSASQNDQSCSDDDVLIRSKRQPRRATSSSILMPFDGVASALNSDSYGLTTALSSSSDDSDADGDTSDDVLECIICRESLCESLDVEIGLLKRCMHVFCFACINCWASRATVCPLCKREFDKIYKAKTSQLSKLDGGRIVSSSKGKLRKCVGPAKSLVSIRNIFDRVPWSICHVKPKQLSIEHAEDAIDTTACEVCAQDNDEERMLLCDACDLGFHLYCLNPPLDAVPSGDWFCPNCLESRSTPRSVANRLGQVTNGRTSRTRRTATSATATTPGPRGRPRRRRRIRRRRTRVRADLNRSLSAVDVDGYGPAAVTRGRRRSSRGESGAAILTVELNTSTTASNTRGNTRQSVESRRINRTIANVQRMVTRPSTISISSSDTIGYNGVSNFRNVLATNTNSINRNPPSVYSNGSRNTITSLFSSNTTPRRRRVDSRPALTRLDVDGLIRRITNNLNAAARQQGQGASITTAYSIPMTVYSTGNTRAPSLSSDNANTSTNQRHASFTYRYRTLLGSDPRGSNSSARNGNRATGNTSPSSLFDAQQRVSITGSTVKYLV